MIGHCTLCPLWQSRTQVVEGAGSLDAPLMIVGEAPGRDEDLSGVPFVGQSGRLLRALLSEVYPNGKVYITNANKCRPPDNRTPTEIEAESCRPYLIDEIRRVKPKVILAVGKSGTVAVTSAVQGLSTDSRPLIVSTWHPAYVLRQPSKKPELRKAIHEAVSLALGRDPLVPPTPAPWTLVESPKLLYPFPEVVGMDTETDDLEEGVGTVRVGWSLSDGVRACFTTDNPGSVVSQLQRMYLHNSKYDLPHLGVDAWDLSRWDDTMLMAYVLRLWSRVGLKSLGPALTGVAMTSITSLLGTGKAKRSFSSALAAEPERATEYAAKDALVTKRLGDLLEPMLRAEPKLWTYYHDIEKPMVPILLAAEQRGVLIDRGALESAGVLLESQIATRRADLADLLGIENPGSNEQLATALLAAGLPLSRTTETGQVQVDKEALLAAVGVSSEADLAPANGYHALIANILAFRKAGKLHGTYIKGIVKRLGPDNILHGRFNQVSTETGTGTSTNRLSSSDPNMQNIPVRTPEGAAIRAAFLPRPGYTLVKADFSQLQLRIFADYVRDPVLLAVYPPGSNVYYCQGCEKCRGKGGYCLESDFHQATADAIGISRKDSKNVNFAVLFGAEEQKLAETAHVPRGEVAGFLKAIRNNVPSLLAWKPYIASLLTRHGYVTTRLGWREYYPQFFSPIRKESAAALREAACLPIQGTEAGIVKATMIAAHPLQVEHGAFLLLQVHDEMVYEVPTEWVDSFVPRLIDLAARIGRRYIKAVPLRLNVETGPNWRDTTEWKPRAMPQEIP